MSGPHGASHAGGDQHAVTAMLGRLAGDQAALAARVTDVEDRVEEFAGAFDDIESLLAPPASSPPAAVPAAASEQSSDGGETVEAGLDMRRLVAWVHDNVALLLERKVPQTGGSPYWCRQWWLHPEAIARFEAARRAWVEAVADSVGTAMVVYFEHLDHQLGVLCGENGPFCGCTRGRHSSSSTVGPLGQDEPDETYFLEFDRSVARGGNPDTPQADWPSSSDEQPYDEQVTHQILPDLPDQYSSE